LQGVLLDDVESRIFQPVCAANLVTVST
jgi:hypothetical protein